MIEITWKEIKKHLIRIVLFMNQELNLLEIYIIYQTHPGSLTEDLHQSVMNIFI